MSTEQLCHECGQPATKLCDFPVGAGTTCDRPMCNYHARCQGRTHFDGTDKRGRRIGWSDTRDYCSEHAAKKAIKEASE